MAWTVIFGLVFATFLTLVIVPVMYLIVDKIKLRAFDKRQEANLNRNKDQQQKEKEQKFALTQQ
jgi:Cu/Ag efflux pump CusA